jgi:hypothetical protein
MIMEANLARPAGLLNFWDELGQIGTNWDKMGQRLYPLFGIATVPLYPLGTGCLRFP